MHRSWQQSLAKLSDTEKQKFLKRLTKQQKEQLLYSWRMLHARPEQLPPDGGWSVWLILAGRGWGKTRTGAEWVRERVACGARRIALVAQTEFDGRRVMVEGSSGLLHTGSPAERPAWEPSKRQLLWPNGAIATVYSAEQPNQLRGPEHDTAWLDELAKWTNVEETWNNLQFGMRIGEKPRSIITTTPRPIPILTKLMNDPRTVLTRGSTYDNAANLAKDFITAIRAEFEHTRIGRQEIHAEILEDVPGALWQRACIDEARVRKAPDLVRIVIAVDPATTCSENSNETGIIVAGRSADDQFYVLHDGSCRLTPDAWARRVVALYEQYKADRIVAEVNNGGEMVEQVIRSVSKGVAFKSVHAQRGKALRAEPVSTLYEQGKVHHVGSFPLLEDQMCNFVPGQSGGSPDRLDALVWGITQLRNKREPSIHFFDDAFLRFEPHGLSSLHCAPFP